MNAFIVNQRMAVKVYPLPPSGQAPIRVSAAHPFPSLL